MTLVLCDTYSDLRRRGLDYRSRSRLTLDKLPDDRVWHRFMVLSDAINNPTPKD